MVFMNSKKYPIKSLHENLCTENDQFNTCNEFQIITEEIDSTNKENNTVRLCVYIRKLVAKVVKIVFDLNANNSLMKMKHLKSKSRLLTQNEFKQKENPVKLTINTHTETNEMKWVWCKTQLKWNNDYRLVGQVLHMEIRSKCSSQHSVSEAQQKI